MLYCVSCHPSHAFSIRWTPQLIQIFYFDQIIYYSAIAFPISQSCTYYLIVQNWFSTIVQSSSH